MDKTVNVGTIGHVDHGKTTLTAALVRALGSQGDNVIVVSKRDYDDSDVFGHPIPTNRIGKGQRKAYKANRWR